MEKKLAELKTRLLEIDDLQRAAAILSWDQNVSMPPGGATARGRQMGTLSRLAHEKFVDTAVGALLDDLQAYGEGLPYDSDNASLIRVARRDYEKATKIPATLLEEINQHSAESYQAWTAARPANDFTAVQPYLEKTVEYSRKMADCFPGYDHIADPLIDFSDGGMKAESIRAVFAELRKEIVPIVKAIAAQPVPDDSFLYKDYPETKQMQFGQQIAEAYGYDFKRGHLAKSPHPFSTSFNIDDVRITTRVNKNNFNDALFSTMHEAGHAMYEQGIDHSLSGTVLADGTSSGVHESQSRLWENQVGRSRLFWEHYYSELQALFPDALGDVSLDSYYRAINKSVPSLIRTDADEVTYNLHVMIRFDLELQLLEGTLAVKDLPEAWNGRYQSDLGVVAPTDTNGVLQDIHWYGGLVGGSFQGYTLGNIMSAQFYAQALSAHPQIPQEVANGQFGTLYGWLRDNIYRHGSKFTADELLERVTGRPLTIAPYLDYLRAKFGELYAL